MGSRRNIPEVTSRGDAKDIARPILIGHFGINCFAALSGLALLWILQNRSTGDFLVNGAITCGAIAGLIAVAEVWFLKVHQRASTGIHWSALHQRDIPRILFKLLGLFVTVGGISLAYWLFPEYSGAFYTPFWKFLKALSPGYMLLGPLYFWWLDKYLAEPQDAYWQLGRLALGHTPGNWAAIRVHVAGWTIKAFFLPLMVVYLSREIESTYGLIARSTDQIPWYDALYHLNYLVDLLFCVIGYCLTLRVLDTQIRSTEPTALGWIAALICYQPFYSLIEAQYLRYEDGFYWGQWLTGYPTIASLWATAIILLLMTYTLSTVAFGLRFSNLTNRGIIALGPYRFTKHPAYIAKNLSWWLISVPFVCEMGFAAALKNCLALASLNLIYFLRAKTEENHLRRDEDYVLYARWISEHGIFAKLGKIISKLRFF